MDIKGIALILIILLIVTIGILSLIISNKDKVIDNLEIKLSMSNNALLRQNAEIEMLKLNKEDLLTVLNKTNRDVENLRSKIFLMPNDTCQDKLKIIDSVFKTMVRP